MKTNKVMIRKMGNFQVTQRTKDAMFNATELLKQWNLLAGTQKKLDHFFENKSTKEYIIALSADLDTRNSVYVKSRASRGLNAGTWMHPYLFIDFAMWLNPQFKLQVIKFVYDQLIKNRHEAGDNYRLLTCAVATLKNHNYPKTAKAINHIVFNKHDKELRQTASEEQLKELAVIEQKIAFAIDMGLVRTQAELINLLRKMYIEKYYPDIDLKS